LVVTPVTALVLPQRSWLERTRAHQRRVDAWLSPALERRARGDAHPVEDFLFDYYPYPPSRLRRWSPGIGIVMQGRAAQSLRDRRGFVVSPEGAHVDPVIPPAQASRLHWVRALLLRTSARAAVMGCFGLHEWAMVYRVDPADRRHPQLAIRVPDEVVEVTVEQVGLRCTHFDALRFFSSEARPRNASTLSRDTQLEHEQPGCLHATMDLYKYCMWLQPLLPAELSADAFELARDARALDMAASPYDLAGYGLAPVPVESAAGRAEYKRRQAEVATRGQELRSRVLAAVEVARSTCGSVTAAR
jgi:hypothetical protein